MNSQTPSPKTPDSDDADSGAFDEAFRVAREYGGEPEGVYIAPGSFGAPATVIPRFLPDPAELDALLVVCRRHGVASFTSGSTSFTLSPYPPAAPSEDGGRLPDGRGSGVPDIRALRRPG